MSEHEQTADILDGAADVIERDGWAPCSFGITGTDPTCANGAIGRACKVFGVGNRLPFSSVFGRFLVASGRTVKHPEDSDSSLVLGWNDAPERTEQEVLDALRLAAKDQRRLADGLES